MSDIGEYLEGFTEEGTVDSSGVFTIDPKLAREKLAEFKLRSRHELILKFAQAAHFGASAMRLSLGETVEVEFADWDSAYTIDRLLERLTLPVQGAGDDVLGYLCVGLSTLSHSVPNGIRIIHFPQGKREGRVLEFESFESIQTAQREEAEASLLKITWPAPPTFGTHKMVDLLKSRCLFLGVPVTIDSRDLETDFPKTPGNYRGHVFNSNLALASRLYLPEETSLPPNVNSVLLEAKRVKEAERFAILMSTVDFEPAATISLTKAGVLLEKKKFDVGYPGIVGVVAADDLETDLTGSRFRDSDKLEEIGRWIEAEVKDKLLPTALEKAETLVTKRPVPPERDTTSDATNQLGCMVAIAGGFLTHLFLSSIENGHQFIWLNWLIWPIIGFIIMVKMKPKPVPKPVVYREDTSARDRVLSVLGVDQEIVDIEYSGQAYEPDEPDEVDSKPALEVESDLDTDIELDPDR